MGRMTEDLEQKLETLLEMLSERPPGGPSAIDRGILIVYRPAEELRFRELLETYLLQMDVNETPYRCVELDSLPFEFLCEQDVLGPSYELERSEPGSLKQYLADGLPEQLLQRVRQAGEEIGEGAVILRSPTALFPWVSYAELLSRLPSDFGCYVVIPFPGSADGANLHFLNRRTGFNYRARRLQI